jgi:hypothetical protein
MLIEFRQRRQLMDDDRTLCVVCAWRLTCNKKFLMDGSTTTRCPEFTRDVTLKAPKEDEGQPQERPTGET